VIVKAAGVVKRWGRTTALAGVDVEIGDGVTGLLGANGAGKTTLLGLILGLHHADEGTLEVLGRDPTTAGAYVRARLGYAPEHDALPGDVKCHDLVRHIAEVHGLPRREAIGRASDALWHVGLGEERFRQIGTMSTGQKQRVKLASALVHDPAMLLLDEPTNGLDPMQRDAMLTLIKRVGTEFGIAVILSSHLLEEVERVCDGVVILSGGAVVASGSLDELRGGGGAYIVEPDERIEDLAAALRAVPLDIEIDGRRLVITGDDDLIVDAVRDQCTSLGIGIRRLQRRTATLEDVFLAAGTTA
jgi:ABC-2 type transport system ATP-binding protein